MKLLAGVVLLVLALVALLLPAAALAQRKGDPTELWEQFPLESKASPAPPTAERERLRIVGRNDGPSTFSMIALMLLAAGTGAMALSLARGRARARAAAQHAAAAPAAAPPVPAVAAAPAPVLVPAPAPTPPASAPAARRAAPQPEQEAPPPTEVLGPVPAMRAPKKPAAPRAAPAKPAAAKRAVAGPPARPSKRRAARPPTRRPPPRQPVGAPPAPHRPIAVAPGWQSCRIRLWRAHTKRYFYAETDAGECIARSPYFDDSGQAAEAIETLLDELVERGWKIASRRPGSWDVALVRRSGARGSPSNSR